MLLNTIFRVHALELNGQYLLTHLVRLDIAQEGGAYTPSTRYVIYGFFSSIDIDALEKVLIFLS